MKWARVKFSCLLARDQRTKGFLQPAHQSHKTAECSLEEGLSDKSQRLSRSQEKSLLKYEIFQVEVIQIAFKATPK